jgi:hypothetical protein
MQEQPDPEMLENLDLLLNWDLLEREADWEVMQGLDNTPVKPPPPPPKPKPSPAEPATPEPKK